MRKTLDMEGLGQRLRQRAEELGLADSAVAQLVGLSQQRYFDYISDQHEPDFETLLRICRALTIEPNVVLGYSPAEPAVGKEAQLRARIGAVANGMSLHTLEITAALVDTLVKVGEPSTASGRAKRRARKRVDT